MDAAPLERSLRAISGVVGCSVSDDGVVLLLTEDADRRAVLASAEAAAAPYGALEVRLLAPPATRAVHPARRRRLVPAAGVVAGVASAALMAAFLPIGSREPPSPSARAPSPPAAPFQPIDVVVPPPRRAEAPPRLVQPRVREPGRGGLPAGSPAAPKQQVVAPRVRVVAPPLPPPPRPVAEDSCIWPGRHLGWDHNGAAARHESKPNCPPANGWRAKAPEERR